MFTGNRTFAIVSHAIDKTVRRTVSARTPHAAVIKHTGENHPGYTFTGGLYWAGADRWNGEAYNETHGLNLYILEIF